MNLIEFKNIDGMNISYCNQQNDSFSEILLDEIIFLRSD
jgi:hypothetical protein